MESDQAIREEHQRLAAQYKAERQLLEEALRESANSSSSTSPEPERHKIKEIVNVEPLQFPNEVLESKKFGILQPIPRKEKKSEESEEIKELEKETKNFNKEVVKVNNYL